MKQTICLIVFLAGLLALFGTAGAVESGNIPTYIFIIRVIVILAIMLGSIIIGKLYKHNEE